MKDADKNLSVRREFKGSVTPDLILPPLGQSAPQYLLRERILGSMHFWSANTSSRRVKKPVHEKEMVRYIWRDGMIRKMTLVAYSSGDLGFPTAVDFEFFLAFESLLLYRVRTNHYLDLVVRFQGQEVIERAKKDGGGRSYQELSRCLLRMKGLMIGIGSGKTDKDQQVHTKSRRPTFMNIFSSLTLPGSVNSEGLVMDGYELVLQEWYRDSLLAGNCFVVDHGLFQNVKGHITKILHQFLSHLFYLGSGSAMQSYSELVEGFELTRYTAISLVRQQLGPAHDELMSRQFLRSWDIVAVKDSKPKEFMLMWEAGPAWRQAEKQLLEQRAFYEIGDERSFVKPTDEYTDPMLLIADAQTEHHSPEEQAASGAKLLHLILELSGRRKDPHIWEKVWRRAIETIPHVMIWRRIHEVKDRLARKERINSGSYLYDLVKRDAQNLKLDWARRQIERKKRSSESV